MLASLPGVLYETLAHPIGIENPIPRRMVLASRFRGSSLRLPLSGMVYCEIATRTLKEVRVLLISKRGRREEKSREEAPITCHGHKTMSRPTPSRLCGSYLPLSKGMRPETEPEMGRSDLVLFHFLLVPK